MPSLTTKTMTVIGQAGLLPAASADDMDQYKRFECSLCNATYEREYDAEECCKPEVFVVYENPNDGKTYDTVNELAQAMGGTSGSLFHCPACGENHGDTYEAASCCMWLDFSPAARWRIAHAVIGGKSWADATAAEANQVLNG